MFTSVLVRDTDVFSCDKLLNTLVKEALTTEFVELKEAFRTDKLFMTLVKDEFIAVLFRATDVFS